MKKILLFLLLFFINFQIIFAQELSVKSNIISWEYSFPIEINLIANDKNAKIFYYTDWIWRMDNIKEFKNPILIKQDTTIDFYATSFDYKDTLIQTSTYTFNYSNNINISWENNEIIIKNNSNEIQNIWYWSIEADDLNYEINPNTFLDIWKTFKINYDLKNNQKINLISPDKKIIRNFIFKKEIFKQKIAIEENNTETWELNNFWETLDNSWKILNFNEIETWSNQEKSNIKTLENKDDFDLNKNLKTSVIDNNSKINTKNNNLYVILWILILFTFYNIWLFFIKSEKFKDFKNKKQKKQK